MLSELYWRGFRGSLQSLSGKGTPSSLLYRYSICRSSVSLYTNLLDRTTPMRQPSLRGSLSVPRMSRVPPSFESLIAGDISQFLFYVEPNL